MKLCSILFFVLACGNLTALNDTLLVKTYYPDKKVYEEFQTTFPDSTPDGNYKSYTKYGKVLSEGRYKTGDKIGIWTYYSEGAAKTEIVEKYDYSTQTESYYNYTYEEVPGAPRFPGGLVSFYDYMLRQIKKRISKEIVNKYKGKKVYISFAIDRKTGKVIDVKIFPVPAMNTINDEAVENILINIIQESPKWALSKNMKSDSTLGFSFNIPIAFK